MKHRAFTVIEAIVVVLILAILTAILFPPSTRTNEGKRGALCRSNLKEIGISFLQYARDADDKAPPIANANGGWTRLIAPYFTSDAIFHCPAADGDKIGATDYFYNARLARTTGKLAPDSQAIATTILSGEGAADQSASYSLWQWPDAWRTDSRSPAKRHLDGANSLFVDGHVKWFSARRIFDEPDAATPTFEVK